MRRAMQTSWRFHFSLLGALGFAAFAVSDARAEWPMARHDPQRTAASTGQSSLERPTIAWRTYLGGSLGAQQVLAADVDGNGTGDVVMLSGGRLVAKRFDDSIVWETAPFDLFRIDALRDLNGDGVLDIVATGRPGRVMVFSSRTGALEWRTSAPPYGPSIGAVRFARLDADMIEDMYIADAACGSTDSAGDVSYAYNFARGFGAGVDNGDQRLWQLERGREYNCGQNDVVADLNNDGRTEVVAFGTRNMYLFEGRTGAKVASGGEDPQGGFPTGFSIPYGTNVTDVVDVDGDGNLDIVGYTNQSYAAAINSRAVFVASYDPRRPAATRLYVRWFRNVSAEQRGGLRRRRARRDRYDLSRSGRDDHVRVRRPHGRGARAAPRRHGARDLHPRHGATPHPGGAAGHQPPGLSLRGLRGRRGRARARVHAAQRLAAPVLSTERVGVGLGRQRAARPRAAGHRPPRVAPPAQQRRRAVGRHRAARDARHVHAPRRHLGGDRGARRRRRRAGAGPAHRALRRLSPRARHDAPGDQFR
jgi:hypothetical protein